MGGFGCTITALIDSRGHRSAYLCSLPVQLQRPRPLRNPQGGYAFSTIIQQTGMRIAITTTAAVTTRLPAQRTTG